jgi:hypothetical protein
MATDPQSIILTFRDAIWRVSPTWLTTGTAQRILYAIAIQLDAAGDAITAGVKLRFPGVYTYESLPLLGRERRIRRGRIEVDPTYATRLVRWLEDHKTRGGPYALLRQLYYHYAPDSFPIVLIYPSGGQFTIDAAGVITYVEAYTGTSEQWAKWSLLYFTDTLPVTTPADLADLAVVPREWIAAHCLGEIIVMPTGAELWNYPPTEPWNGPGLWDTADNTIRVPVR